MTTRETYGARPIACAVRAALAALVTGAVVASAAAAASPAAPPHSYKVGKRILLGRAKTICVIEGKWASGEPFRYEGWDSCAKLTVTPAKLGDYKDWPARGGKGALTVADIPAGAETIEVSNGASSVLVFRDAHGETRDVLIRD